MTKIEATPPINFTDALGHFRAANQRAREIHDENEQAAYYQENVPDESLRQLILDPLAQEQEATVGGLREFVELNLYKQLGARYIELLGSLSGLPPEDAEALRALDEEEERVNTSSEAALTKALQNKNYPADRIMQFIEAVGERKQSIAQKRDEIESKSKDDSDEVARIETLLKVAGHPWPIPYIRYFLNRGPLGPEEYSIGDLASRHEEDVEEYLSGNGKYEEEHINWEAKFTTVVDSAIQELFSQRLLTENEVHRNVIFTKSPSDIMGSLTAIDRLQNAGVISKEKRDSMMMGPFEIVCNRIFNSHKDILGRGPHQKRAIEIVYERIATFFASQHQAADERTDH
jgi:hypothetical protein